MSRPPGEGQEEGASRAVPWHIVGDLLRQLVQWYQGRVVPAQGAGLVVVTFRDDGLKACQGSEPCEIHFAECPVGFVNRLLDVEVAPLEDAVAASELSVDDERGCFQVIQRCLDLILRRVASLSTAT